MAGDHLNAKKDTNDRWGVIILMQKHQFDVGHLRQRESRKKESEKRLDSKEPRVRKGMSAFFASPFFLFSFLFWSLKAAIS